MLLVAHLNLFAISALLSLYSYAIFNIKMFQDTLRPAHQAANRHGGNQGARAVDAVVPTENVFRQHM